MIILHRVFIYLFICVCAQLGNVWNFSIFLKFSNFLEFMKISDFFFEILEIFEISDFFWVYQQNFWILPNFLIFQNPRHFLKMSKFLGFAILLKFSMIFDIHECFKIPIFFIEIFENFGIFFCILRIFWTVNVNIKHKSKPNIIKEKIYNFLIEILNNLQLNNKITLNNKNITNYVLPSPPATRTAKSSSSASAITIGSVFFFLLSHGFKSLGHWVQFVRYILK